MVISLVKQAGECAEQLAKGYEPARLRKIPLRDEKARLDEPGFTCDLKSLAQKRQEVLLGLRAHGGTLDLPFSKTRMVGTLMMPKR
ncbi:MAG: hypothetical protein ACLRX5_02580 [Slackia sp.]